MSKRMRFSKYDRFILQGILHGYETLKDIHAYVLFRIRSKDLLGEVSRSQISQLLKLLVDKKILYVEEVEKDKKTWRYKYKLNNKYIDVPFSRDFKKSQLDIFNKPPLIFAYHPENNFNGWYIEELCKKIIIERALKTYPCPYLKIVEDWINKIDKKIPPVPRITFSGKFINDEIVIMEEMEKIIGRRDKYILLTIQHLLNRRTPHYIYLYPKLAKIYLERFKSTLPPQLKGELDEHTYDKNILDFYEEKLWETVKELPPEPIPCQDVEIENPTLKVALNDLADAFDYVEDRDFQRSFQVILI